jgi:hypothetical protein
MTTQADVPLRMIIFRDILLGQFDNGIFKFFMQLDLNQTSSGKSKLKIICAVCFGYGSIFDILIKVPDPFIPIAFSISLAFVQAL